MGDSMSTIINATTTNGVVIQPDNSGSLVLQTNSGTTALTIDTSQNVGIGTTAPDTLLHLSNESAKIRIGQSASSAYLDISRDSATGYFIYNAAQATPYRSHIWQLGGTEAMRIDSSGNLLFNSGYGSVTTAYGCRAWVNFNGTGTVAIRASGGVTSITDNGTGNYTINLSFTMPDANYCVAAAITATNTAGASDCTLRPYTLTTTAASVATTANGTLTDSATICAAIFR